MLRFTSHFSGIIPPLQKTATYASAQKHLSSSKKTPLTTENLEAASYIQEKLTTTLAQAYETRKQALFVVVGEPYDPHSQLAQLLILYMLSITVFGIALPMNSITIDRSKRMLKLKPTHTFEWDKVIQFAEQNKRYILPLCPQKNDTPIKQAAQMKSGLFTTTFPNVTAFTNTAQAFGLIQEYALSTKYVITPINTIFTPDSRLKTLNRFNQKGLTLTEKELLTLAINDPRFAFQAKLPENLFSNSQQHPAEIARQICESLKRFPPYY